MAKKKQNVVIVDEELVPTTLAIKQDKKKVSIFGIVWIVLIFAIFIAGVIYLPTISQYVVNYFNPVEFDNTNINTDTNKKDNKDLDNQVTNKDMEYTISDELVIDLKDFSVSNIKIENKTLSFDITNNGEKILEFKNLNYFVILSDSNKKLLQRIMLKDEVVTPKETVNYKYTLDSEDTSVIAFRKIEIKDYPAFMAVKDDNGVSGLTCSREYETVKYMLNDNKVYAISDVYVVSISDENYNTLYGTYQTLASTYSNINGVSSVVSVNDDNLEFKTIISLTSVGANTLNSKIYYSKDTDAKVMKFELEASGFKCSQGDL